MTIFFISDIHLEENRPEISALFFDFLQKISLKSNSLYILGDFFESWVGDDDLTPFNLGVIQHLHQARINGLTIYIMHGNRDFLLGKQFFQKSGCTLLSDPYVIHINNHAVLLMHGDSLCIQDIQYQKFRKKARSWWFKKFILFKSLAKRKEIARSMREASKKYTATASEHIMDVTQSEVDKVMHQHGVNILIHGHTHRLAQHKFILNDKNAVRYVLGAWHDGGNALMWEENADGPRMINITEVS